MRTSALAVLLLICTFSRSAGWVVLLLLPAFVAVGLELRRAQRGAVDEQHLLWWALSALVLVVAPAWVLLDLPFVLRALALAAAMIVIVSVVTAGCVAPAWFDPARPRRVVAEGLRPVAGPLTVGLTAAVVVPAPWPSEVLPAVWALAALPLVVGSRVRALDQTVRNAVPLIRQQGQLGRDQVLREIHGALSTELRQLEQYARDYRTQAPELYERAVIANSSLRETLTLGDEERETSTTTDTLMAPVLTLIRAEGASVDTRIEVDWLHPSDREVARYVLNELVGNALQAGASWLQVTISGDPAAEPRRITISVTDDAEGGAEQHGVRAGPGTARLTEILTSRDGTLTAPEPGADPPTTVRACWQAHP